MCVCGGMWVFLRRRACEGEFKLYTDVESKLEHYTKIRNLFRAVVCLETVCLFFEIMEAVTGSAAAGERCRAFWLQGCCSMPLGGY